jgi:NAD(P)-dependent dehydrogenase (short-subunit alcohol dehydrogenase family)
VSDPLDFRGKVALVTGGARGVGRGIAESFLAAGAEVVICGRNAPEAPPEAGARKAHFVSADVRDAEHVKRLVAEIASRFGRLDVAVNNAGGAPEASSAEASPRFTERIIQLNLLGPLYVAQHAYGIMHKQPEGGVIINISSVSGIRPSPGTTAYGAAKAGLLSATQSLAVEWAPKVRVVAVTVGMVRTEQAHLHYGDEAGIAAVGATVPLGRLAEPREVGNVCLFLASPLASYVSGSSLLMHGGGEVPAFRAAREPSGSS